MSDSNTSITARWLENMPKKYRIWIDAVGKYRLSEAQLRMAIYLGMNPDELEKFISINSIFDRKQVPLLIENLYYQEYVET